MQYLLLAIISSALVSIVMRLSTTHVKNNMSMFMSNYAICILLSIIFGLRVDLSAVATTQVWFPLGLGIIAGILFLGCFMLLQTNIKRNGVVLSTTFMKLGVIVPTIMAIVVFHEKPKAAAILGILLAIVAIIIINQDPNAEEKGTSNHFLLLLILLFAGGFTDSLSNIYDKCGVASLKDFYLLCTFSAAFLSSLVMKLYKKQIFTVADSIWGAILGIPNYFSARFLLLSLSQIPATIVYPVYNIADAIVFWFSSHLYSCAQ